MRYGFRSEIQSRHTIQKTGDSTDSRKKATGIGLYLVKKMADDLNLRLEAASPWEKGFKIVIFFPKLKSNGGK